MKPGQLRNRLLLSLGFGVAVVAALLLWGDFKGVASSLAHFRWVYMPAILSLTLFNYAIRFVKWHYYVRLTGVKDLRLWDSLLIFLAGLGMTITPGKVGEWMKSYFIRESHGVPMNRTAPIVIAERLTDAFGMIILAALGLLLLDQGWIFLLVVTIMGALIVAAFEYRPFGKWSIHVAGKVPLLHKHAASLEGFYDSAFVLFSPKPLVISILMGVVSWAGEGIALYYVFRGLGVPNSGELVVQGIFILSITTLAGAVFLLPGGLGVAEGGIAGLSRQLVGLSREGAATATLLIRIATLWFGVSIGVVAILVVTQRLKRKPVPVAALAEDPGS